MVRSNPATLVDLRTCRRIAAAAEGLDPRTVRNYFEGRGIRVASAAVIRQALAKLGLPDPRSAQ